MSVRRPDAARRRPVPGVRERAVIETLADWLRMQLGAMQGWEDFDLVLLFAFATLLVLRR